MDSNIRIYKNQRVINTLLWISFIVGVIIFLVELPTVIVNKLWSENVAFFYMMLICLPFCMMEPRTLELREKIKVMDEAEGREFIEKTAATKINVQVLQKAYSRNLRKIFYPLIAYLLTAFVFWGNLPPKLRIPYSALFGGVLGGCIISHVFIYIAIIYIIYNCHLIKMDLNKTKQKIQEIDEKKKFNEEKARAEEENKIMGKQLIEKSGIRFFLKYYKDIRDLPMRDIEIVEHYDSNERMERLSAAKKIIDCNLTMVVLNEIQQNYSNKLKEEERDVLKKLILEMEKE